MSVRTLLVFLFVTMGFGIMPVQAAEKTGMWEIEMTMNMANLPMQIPPQSMKQCLTREKMVPQTQTAEGCVVNSKGLKGNRVEWTFQCQTANGPASGSGYMVFSGNRLSGQTQLVILVNGEKLTTTTLLKGHRIGDC